VTAKENPGVGTGASEDSGESTTDSIVSPNRASASKRLQLSPAAAAWITARAHDLATGELAFWQLPPSLVEFYYVAFFAGRETLAPELEQARRKADRLYGVAYGPKVTPEPSNYLTYAQLEQFRADLYAGAK
jgi:hypothetical protein